SAFSLYAIDGNFAPDSGQTSTLYRIDPEDGSVLDVVGDTGLNLTAIVYWPPAGRFLATTALQSTSPSFLIEIDPFTAEANPLQELTEAPNPVFGIEGPYQFTSLEIDPGGRPGRLLAFNTNDERGVLNMIVEDAALFINPFLSAAPQGSFALAASDADDFRLQWVFFGCESPPSIESYYRSLIATSSPPIIPIIIDLPDSSCFIDGLRIAQENYLGIQIDRANTIERQLTHLSIQEGQATLRQLGPLPNNTASIARGPILPSNVPTLSKWALILSVLLIVLLGGWSLRNRIV
ncbi:MAG: IPTL-CTERM sorting domain-containing protein, partial [Pseudomonadota bacterium]